MSTLWDDIATQLRRLIPEGSREELLGQTSGYVTQGGDLSVRSANQLALLTLEQDYGDMLQMVARGQGFDGPITYVVVSPLFELSNVVVETRPTVRVNDDQLSLFGQVVQPIHMVANQAAEESSAAFRAKRADDLFVSRPQETIDDFSISARQAGPSVHAPQVLLTAPMIEAAGLVHARGLASWVCGEENLFTHGAASAMASGDNHFGPMLYIHGAAGLGKTHLLQAIGMSALEQNPTLRVRYVRSEDFVNEYISAVKTRTMDAFRARTRQNVDLLLLDDVDFLGGKERCQEEFRQTLDALLAAQRRVVVTSVVARHDLGQFEARLRNLMTTGLSVNIDAPSIVSRRDILYRAAERSEIAVPADVLDLVARTVRCDTRELLAHFSRILSYAKFTGNRLSVEVARQQLDKSYREVSLRISVEEIVDRTVEFYDLKAKDIIGRGRTKRVAEPRKVAMYLARQWTDSSFPELGKFFDNRDHTTVLNATQSITKRRLVDPDLNQAIETIERRLGVGR